MRTSEKTDVIDAEMTKAQKGMPNPDLDKKNPRFGNGYTSLANGLSVAKEHLAAHGISVYQATRVEEGIMMLDTRLACKGQWLEAEYPVCKFPANPQEIGSALTYARRYSLFALVGIAGEEDDDGTEANKTPTQAPKREAGKADKKEPEQPAPDYSKERDVAIKALQMAETVADLDKWGVVNAAEINRMPAKEQQDIRDAFAAHRKHLQQQKEAA